MIENLFLSVGAMKAGTTWLYEQFRGHPDVYFTPEKEIHYFANRIGIEDQLSHRSRVSKLKQCMASYGEKNPKNIAENIEEICWYAEFARPRAISHNWYESLFRFSNARYCADFSNLYCLIPAKHWHEVYEVAKNVKIVYTVRDPLARLWSHYKFHMKWAGREDEILAAGFRNFEAILSKDWFWRNTEYAKNYNELLAGVGAENVKLLYFEDVHHHPLAVIHDLEQMLGIRHAELDEGRVGKRVNATKSIEMPAEWKQCAVSKLSFQMAEMKECGIWHPDWNERE